MAIYGPPFSSSLLLDQTEVSGGHHLLECAGADVLFRARTPNSAALCLLAVQDNPSVNFAFSYTLSVGSLDIPTDLDLKHLTLSFGTHKLELYPAHRSQDGERIK